MKIKNIIAVLAIAFGGSMASAQDFAFVKDGKDLADNATVEVGYTEVVPGILYDWKAGIDFRFTTPGVYVFELVSTSEMFTMCPQGNCYSPGKPIELSISGTSPYDLGVHPPTGPLLQADPTSGSIVAYKKDAPDKKITVKVNYYNKPASEVASVGELVGNGEKAEYYNLQGVKISAPTKGQIVVKRQGKKTAKVVYK